MSDLSRAAQGDPAKGAVDEVCNHNSGRYQWFQKGVGLGVAPSSNECGSLSQCARFVIRFRAIDQAGS